MRYLFVSQGLVDQALVDELDDARVLREDADYRATFSQISANHSLQVARQMLERVGDLLKDWKDPQ
jgi:hypothetical protein